MARKPPSNQRLDTSGGSNLASHNPFAALSSQGLPQSQPAQPTPEPAGPTRPRGRVDLKREKKGRGGKTVTVIGPFPAGTQLEPLAKVLKHHCATGGAAKHPHIELQGDARDKAAAFLESLGFRPVFAGG